jgi:hypothetical protein
MNDPHVVRASDYPAAPQAFTVSPEVDLMYARYVLYCQGRTQLSDISYYCYCVSSDGGARRS